MSPVVRLTSLTNAYQLVKNVEHGIGYDFHGFDDRTLRGEVVVLPDRYGTLAVVNVVPEEILVAGILPAEMFASAPMAALKAQAVTARGEIFAKIGKRHSIDPYLLCSEQHCQVYKGLTAEHHRTNQAAKETRGQLAFHDGHLVDSVILLVVGVIRRRTTMFGTNRRRRRPWGNSMALSKTLLSKNAYPLFFQEAF